MSEAETPQSRVESETLQMFRDAIDSLTQGFALFDRDKRLVMFNQSYRKMSYPIEHLLEPGVTREFLIRETAKRGGYVQAAGREEEWVSNWLANTAAFSQELEMEKSDGTCHLISTYPTKLGGLVVVSRDITQKKKKEAQQRDRDNLVRTVLETSPTAIIMTRLEDGEVIYRSPAAAELFGTKKSAAQHFASPEDHKNYQEAFASDGRVDGFNADFAPASGDNFTATVSGRVVEYDGEKVVVSNITDLTEQLEADAIVRTVLDASSSIITMVNIDDGEILYRTPAAFKLFGKSRTALENYVRPQERKDIVEKLQTHGHIENHGIEFKNANGQPFPASLSARIIEYNGERVMVSTTRDLTDALALEEELNSQRELLFQNEKMSAMGELLAGVAHELNNPLSIVVGHSLMLREEAEEPKTVRRIEKISSAAERSAKIVKTFLAMARQQPTRMERTDINAVISAAVDVAGYGRGSETLSIKCDLDDNVPQVTADADQITQVIINLIINAEQAINKANEGNLITVSTKVRKSGQPGEAVEITVKDNGPGIPENVRARVFEPFFTTKDVGDGTGIGLAFCHRIIRSHGGEIWLDAKHPNGSKFVMTLPIVAGKPLKAERFETTTRSAGTLRALVVDDEVGVAELISEILVMDGFVADIAHSGLEAMSCLKKQNYDLLLADLNMPVVDGPGLFAVLKKEHPEMLTVTGFITGDTMGSASQQFLQEAKRPYLEKPVSPAELRELVHGILDGQNQLD